MREKYEQELRVAQLRGVLSQQEADSLITEGLRQGCHPLELLVARGVLSEETLAEIRAAAYGTGAPLHAGLKHGETRSFHRPSAEPPPREEEPLTPGSPTRTLQPGALPAAAPAKPLDAPVTPGSPTLTVHPTPNQTTPYPQEPAFPVPGWERYQPVRFLGQGGMGRVYLAYDPLLRRNVALKFVRGDDPELIHRFVSEAQAQARVEHERVCKVYEVGEVQGQPFIAMQYVEGRSLLDLIRELSLEQKVMVMQQVTEGVHAAHRAGLIHRDIKPTNILVERGEDGRWKPYVMDFGLARDWQREATVTGTVLGTPHYMAPEQARGEVSQLDRRADVYSLGATLYVMLTGKTPIPGTNAMEVLTNLATLEARPLREHDKNVPVDLEAIVLKCLEREPSARYDSARALAEDLGRFLNGEPVHARPVGTWYRLRKKARKHRVLVSVVSVALVLVLLALGQAAVTKFNAAERERLISDYTELAGDIRSQARFIAMSPLHDTTAARAALRERLVELQRAMGKTGEVAQGPGNYALGLGWLDLGEPAKARDYLLLALEHGFDEERVASPLALALGQLYNEQLQSVQTATAPLQADNESGKPGSAEALKARRAELERQYRDPALAWLRKSQREPFRPKPYMQALLAFYEDRYADALTELNTLSEQVPGFYEAPKLRGDIFHVRAWSRWNENARTQEAREQAEADLLEAQKAYTQAAEAAESWPDAYYGLARVEWTRGSMQLYSGGKVQPRIELALEHLSNALRAAPDHTASWVLQATLYRNLAKEFSIQSDLTQSPLVKAVESASKALTLAPSNLEAHKELGLDWLELASVQEKQGQDPRESLRRSFEIFGAIEPSQQDAHVQNNLGILFQIWADYEDDIGADSLTHRSQSIEALRGAVALKKNSVAGWVNLSAQYYKRATHPRAPSTEEDLQQALQALEQALTLSPQNFIAHFQSARIHRFRAQLLREAGRDEGPVLAQALAACASGLALHPNALELQNFEGLVYQEKAQGAWERGEDPLPFLERAQRAFERVRSAAPRRSIAYENLSALHALRAQYLHARGQDPRPSARAAQQAAQEAQRLAPTYQLSRINHAHASQLLAAFALKTGEDPRPWLSQAQETLGKVLLDSPTHTEAWLYLAQARETQALWHAQQGPGLDEEFQAAAEAYRQALSAARSPSEYRVAFGRFCYEWATWRQRTGLDPTPVLDEGQAQADAVLARRPTWAEARALRAGLQLARFQSREGAEAEARFAQSLKELREVLEASPHLQQTWERASHPSR